MSSRFLVTDPPACSLVVAGCGLVLVARVRACVACPVIGLLLSCARFPWIVRCCSLSPLDCGSVAELPLCGSICRSRRGGEGREGVGGSGEEQTERGNTAAIACDGDDRPLRSRLTNSSLCESPPRTALRATVCLHEHNGLSCTATAQNDHLEPQTHQMPA